jgi:hypothetical protein
LAAGRQPAETGGGYFSDFLFLTLNKRIIVVKILPHHFTRRAFGKDIPEVNDFGHLV